MKSLTIQSNTFKVLLEQFQEDLQVRNKSNSIIYNMPNHIQEFFYYLERKGHQTLDFVTTAMVSDYYHKYLKIRKNKTRPGALKPNSLNKHQEALGLFYTFLKESSSKKIRFGIHLKYEKTPPIDKKEILKISEVRELFDACEYSNVSEKFQLRDRAILVILYSCALRRNEAVGINISDIDFENKRIYVRNGSRNKKRKIPYVEINDYNLRILKDYIELSRPMFYRSEFSDALFLNKNGNRMQGQTFANRLNEIIKATQDENIIERNLTPHSLRHSCATHLLRRGLSIEEVSDFLGHNSLDSTQIYTHLIDDDDD